MNTITEILTKHTRPLTDEKGLDSEKLEQLRREQVVLNTCKTNLLKIEQEMRLAIETREKETEQELRKLRLKQFLSDKKYPILDAEPFRWRNEQGLPKLALFSVLEPECYFQYHNRWGFYHPKLPSQYKGVWDDLKSVMAAELAPRIHKAKQWRRLLPFGFADIGGTAFALALSLPEMALPWLTIPLFAYGVVCLVCSAVMGYDALNTGWNVYRSAQWRGLIPEQARVKICEAKNTDGQVFLLAEVEKWGTTIKTDPLILVSDGEWFYVAGSFNTTTLEEYIAREFATQPG